MKVAVILSTYNGEKYLEEQIDSILNQEEVDVDLFIRDDGSSDGTRKILDIYKNSYENIRIDIGVNKGFRRSFIEELLSVSDYEFYAFSDQDDYWEPQKLIAGIRKIQDCGNSKETVYYSNLNVSDENLNIYHKTRLEERIGSLESVIMRRSIAGCTMIFNKQMWECIASSEITDDMLRRGHDSFIITLCYAVGGDVICDDAAYIKYRQHVDNTSGSSRSVTQRIKKEWNALVNKKGAEPAIARSILLNWEKHIDSEKKDSLRTIAESRNFKNRIKILFSRKFVTGNIKLTLLGKFRAVAGLL